MGSYLLGAGGQPTMSGGYQGVSGWRPAYGLAGWPSGGGGGSYSASPGYGGTAAASQYGGSNAPSYYDTSLKQPGADASAAQNKTATGADRSATAPGIARPGSLDTTALATNQSNSQMPSVHDQKKRLPQDQQLGENSRFTNRGDSVYSGFLM